MLERHTAARNFAKLHDFDEFVLAAIALSKESALAPMREALQALVNGNIEESTDYFTCQMCLKYSKRVDQISHSSLCLVGRAAEVLKG